MRKISLSLVASLLFFACAFPVLCQTNATAKGIEIGETTANFELSDLNGKMHSLSSLKGEKGVLVIFLSAKCPVSNAYNDRIEKLAQDYKARGINVVGINANFNETEEEIKKHAAQVKFSFVILKDRGNKIADRFNARVTPETYLFDSSLKLLYHGRIDNSKNLEQVKSSELREALDLILEGKPISKARTLAFGCTINRGL